MKKTLIDKISNKVPQNMQHLVTGMDIYDSSSSPRAHIYFVDKNGSYYLKYAKTGTLKKEARMTQYFRFEKLGAKVLNYTSGDHGWLLTKAVVRHDCIDNEYLNHPKRLCDMIATELRRLHEIDCSDCPMMSRTTEYLMKAENNYRTGNYGRSSFLNSFNYRSAEQAHEALTAGKDALQSQVLLHRDYCLSNIILDNWELSGFIDLNCAGADDRHIDLFWGIQTLWFNLRTNQHHDRFLDAYGRDRVDEELLKVVAAAEVLG